MLTRDQILQADDLKHIDVDVPEWGGQVRVKVLSMRERIRFQDAARTKDGKTPENIMELLVVACAIDEKGEPLFKPEDVAALGEKSSEAVRKVFDKAMDLNGMNEKSVDDLAGESEPSPSACSCSD